MFTRLLVLKCNIEAIEPTWILLFVAPSSYYFSTFQREMLYYLYFIALVILCIVFIQNMPSSRLDYELGKENNCPRWPPKATTVTTNQLVLSCLIANLFAQQLQNWLFKLLKLLLCFVPAYEYRLHWIQWGLGGDRINTATAKLIKYDPLLEMKYLTAYTVRSVFIWRVMQFL